MRFRGDYAFLSNFYAASFRWECRRWPTVEHAYQAAKNLKYADLILECETPGEAKRLGGQLSLREDWEEIKVHVMLSLLRAKFYYNPELAERLKGIEEYIQEDNTWGDTFWGVCEGVGENMLGRLLMRVRQELLIQEKR